jgi:hypothetical protein
MKEQKMLFNISSSPLIHDIREGSKSYFYLTESFKSPPQAPSPLCESSSPPRQQQQTDSFTPTTPIVQRVPPLQPPPQTPTLSLELSKTPEIISQMEENVPQSPFSVRVIEMEKDKTSKNGVVMNEKIRYFKEFHSTPLATPLPSRCTNPPVSITNCKKEKKKVHSKQSKYPKKANSSLGNSVAPLSLSSSLTFISGRKKTKKEKERKKLKDDDWLLNSPESVGKKGKHAFKKLKKDNSVVGKKKGGNQENSSYFISGYIYITFLLYFCLPFSFYFILFFFFF